jgi:superfamily II DNA or RNA helicase
MWGGQARPLATSELHVIVATIQTLSARFSAQDGGYDFLSDFELVVFDEAHRSIAPTFTSVMQDLGLTRFQRGHEPFLLGLTATPSRGHDESETERLVRRYGSNRLDAGAFSSDDPQAVIQELQDMGVLAQADHQTIKGETFSADMFSPQELERAQSSPWLPQSVEDRIARSVERTRRIVEAYEAHVHPDWPTLIFATSVEHAKTVAALLTQKGIRSRAVSGETETAVRRRMVEEFRSGEIRALVNYGVFREGFDAPKTRAIIVARPVYSPNLYFQMIGRGLRGPKNGGDERCLVLNVQDSIANFQRALAFSDLDWLWSD